MHLAGYSQGGMFCYQAAAYRRSDGIAGVITFGAPVDLRGAIPLGLPEEIAVRGANALADHVLARRALPAWASRTVFRLLDPAKTVQQRLEFLLALHDREALLPRERQRRFLGGEGWVAWPGPALAEFMRQFLQHNRMLQGGFTVGDRLVTLADIDSPILTFVGEVDEIAPAAAVRPIRLAAPRPPLYEVALPAGHFGLVVGRRAAHTTWPVVAAWARWVDEGGPLPESVRPVTHEDGLDGGSKTPDRLRYGLELLADAGVGTVKGIAGSVAGSAKAVGGLAREAAATLPRQARLERVSPDTRISLALLLDERAQRTPDDVGFLYGDRGYTYGRVKARIDHLVLGLLSIGVREGEPVGVLFGIRPTALGLVAALNRLGAVAVMLRPGEDVAQELAIAGATRVVVDPEFADLDLPGITVHPFLLDLPDAERHPAVVPLDRVDPADVTVPAWYRPNGGRAQDLAFVLFTGEGTATRANRITNGRWALSAFGTASAAGLSAEDTVFGVNPVYHPSGLLTAVGGAVAGGARLAMAASLDPATFWEEARRYGITAVADTWAQLGELADAPPHPGEIGHPVRVFLGSGMPNGLWRRLEERFAPARVLEFWASTEGEAVLANVRGAKRGAVGRPLPGSAEVRIAGYDLDLGRIREDDRGLAVEAVVGEPGLLLARLRPGQARGERVLRGVFEPGDAWTSSETLFRRDGDGDFWIVDALSALVRTAGRVIAPRPYAEALAELEPVDLALGYGVPAADGTEVAVAAVTLQADATLEADDVTAALAHLPPRERPAIVRVVDALPLTAWYRPLAPPLRAQPIRVHAKRRPAFFRSGGSYKPLRRADRDRILSGE